MSYGDRISVEKDRSGLSITIKAPRNWFLVFFLPIWLTGWTFGGIMAISALVKGPDRSPFLMVWLCGWAAGEVIVALNWLWTVFGREVVSVRAGSFVHRREVFGYGLERSYAVQEVFNLRASGDFGTQNRWGNNSLTQMSGGTIAVDTKYGDTYRFGINLEEREAVAVAKELSPYLNSRFESHLIHGFEPPPPPVFD
jgi:hypothetical protein